MTSIYNKCRILINKLYKKNEFNYKCIICYDTQIACKIITLTCSHSFHSECLNKWIDIQHTCPLCRKYICVLNEIDMRISIQTIYNNCIQKINIDVEIFFYELKLYVRHIYLHRKKIYNLIKSIFPFTFYILLSIKYIEGGMYILSEIIYEQIIQDDFSKCYAYKTYTINKSNVIGIIDYIIKENSWLILGTHLYTIIYHIIDCMLIDKIIKLSIIIDIYMNMINGIIFLGFIILNINSYNLINYFMAFYDCGGIFNIEIFIILVCIINVLYVYYMVCVYNIKYAYKQIQ